MNKIFRTIKFHIFTHILEFSVDCLLNYKITKNTHNDIQDKSALNIALQALNAFSCKEF